MKTTLYAAIVTLAEAGLQLQSCDGSTPPGHNGAHGDPEQPSRNTGHWLLNWSFVWKLTGDTRFQKASNTAIDYLVRSEHRPGGFTVHHRDRLGKDKCNGLMGPAFSIESLAEGGERLGREDAVALAVTLSQMHPFDSKHGLWQIREIDGSLLGIDWTLNHQLWFAAAITMADRARGASVSEQVHAFVENLEELLVLRPNGRVAHLARNLGRGAKLRTLARNLGLAPKAAEPSPREVKREIAYHLFNLAPMALLARALPDAAIWRSEKLRTAIDYLECDEYQGALVDPSFVQPHIPAGFPLSFAERTMVNQTFGPARPDLQKLWLEEQFARTFDFRSNAMVCNSADPITQAARSYEMTRIENVEIELPFASLCDAARKVNVV